MLHCIRLARFGKKVNSIINIKMSLLERVIIRRSTVLLISLSKGSLVTDVATQGHELPV
jgi:hypothetical protein